MERRESHGYHALPPTRNGATTSPEDRYQKGLRATMASSLPEGRRKTALSHNVDALIEDVKHFERAGVHVVSPWGE
jgi:hypothetical protein